MIRKQQLNYYSKLLTDIIIRTPEPPPRSGHTDLVKLSFSDYKLLLNVIEWQQKTVK